MNIGLKIRELMSKQNIEIPELAKRLGKTKQAVYDLLEKEDVHTSLLRELANIFSVNITTFFDENGNVNSAIASGNGQAVAANGNIQIGDFQVELENRNKEIEHLKVLLKEKDKQLEEKERLINVLLGPSK